MKAENVSMLNGKNKTRRKWFKEKLDSWFGLHGVLQRLKGDGQSTIHISRRTTCKLWASKGIQTKALMAAVISSQPKGS